MLKIRLARHGRRNRPHYRIVVADSRTRRDGRSLVRLGWYDPMQEKPEKKISLNKDEYTKWLKKGAQPSETLIKLLKHTKVGV